MSIKDYISLYVFLRNMKYELENISFNWHQCQMKLDWLRDLSTNYICDIRLAISTVDHWLCKWKDSNKNIDSHHSSVDPPAPTILWPRVRIPTATRMLWFINLNSNCNVKNRSGLAHWKKPQWLLPNKSLTVLQRIFTWQQSHPLYATLTS